MEEKKPYTIKYITKEQYAEIITKGSTVIDGETFLYEDNLSDKDSNDMFDETVIDTLKEMAVKHSNDSYVYRVLVNAINLIHRLQSEKKELKSIAEYQQGSNMERWRIIQEKDKTIDKQKAEIERLTEENAIIKGNPPIIAGTNLGKMIRAKLLAFDKMKEQNDELQKQVDELSDHLSEKQNALWDLQDDFDNLLAEGKQQAVKDTAKEILQIVKEKDYDYLWSLERLIKERYGVEVE